MIATYATMAVMAIILLIGYIFLVHQKEIWILMLYISVTVVNVGYFLLSISQSLAFAIFANDLCYLGSVYLSMYMFFTIFKLCGYKVTKKLTVSLVLVGACMFCIILSSGFLPIYYKEVSLVFVDGAATLKKVYGPLHFTYMIYLIAYFVAMIVCIACFYFKNKGVSQKHASLIAAVVFVNIAIWFIEKFLPIEYEFLSVSYLFSEIVFLGLYWMMQDYVRSDTLPAQEALRYTPVDIAVMPMEEKILKVLSFLNEGETLAQRERQILELVLENKRRKEIADELHLSENTIKTYTRSLYSKLGVTSREEVYAMLVK